MRRASIQVRRWQSAIWCGYSCPGNSTAASIRTGETVTDASLVAAVQTLFARDMAEATDWTDLKARLSLHGYELRPAGRCLMICTRKDGTPVCDTATVGYRYGDLVRKFGCPIPGHPHGATWVEPAEETPQPNPKPFGVIERDPVTGPAA